MPHNKYNIKQCQFKTRDTNSYGCQENAEVHSWCQHLPFKNIIAKCKGYWSFCLLLCHELYGHSTNGMLPIFVADFKLSLLVFTNMRLSLCVVCFLLLTMMTVEANPQCSQCNCYATCNSTGFPLPPGWGQDKCPVYYQGFDTGTGYNLQNLASLVDGPVSRNKSTLGFILKVYNVYCWDLPQPDKQQWELMC